MLKLQDKHKGGAIWSIEFLRILFTILIILRHGVFDRWWEARYLRPTDIIVDFFFIIGGYLLYDGFIRRPLTFKEFALRRFWRLWPAYAASIILLLALGQDWNKDIISSLLMLVNVGLPGRSVNFFAWFVCAYFWTSMLFYFALLHFERRKLLFLTAVVAWLCYTALEANFGSLGVHAGVMFNAFPRSIARAVAGMGLGIILREIAVHIKPARGGYWVWTAASVLGLGFIFNALIFSKSAGSLDIQLVAVFSILLLGMATSAGAIFSWLNRFSWVGHVSKYCYGAYVFQAAAFAILGHFTIGKRHYAVYCVLLSFALAAAWEQIMKLQSLRKNAKIAE